ncbi:MAG: nicotinamide-nucleotide amidohydrolase family protein [Rhabdochlamydiaceae bacterium]|jgi:nicotinamide-nucleotide amidase
MSIEIVAVGSELLRGMIVNTNAAFLGRRLDEEGWTALRQTTLPDERSELCKGLKECLDRSSIVISTGGVGPTLDDITPQCAATLFSSPGKPLKNRIGSASGVYFKEGKRMLFLLPGVPQEMEVMFDEEVLPMLPPQKKGHRVSLHFSMLRENDVDPFLREMEFESGIYPSWGTLTVVLRGDDLAALERGKEKLKKQFHEHYYESPSGKLEEAIQEWMIRHKKTVACAESCTGGMISFQLTQIPGASNYFLGSLVTYSNHLKEKLLHVSPGTLKSEGAVSRETVHEMWKGVLQATGADFGVAVSGIAGPSGGTPDKPVGTVFYALGFKGSEPEIGTFHFKGPRSLVILRTTRRLLALIWEATAKY